MSALPRWALATAFAGALAGAGSAHAGTASCNDDPAFRSLYAEAQELLDRGGAAGEALALLELAWAQCPSLSVRFAQAVALEQQERLFAAATTLEGLLGLPDAPLRARIVERLERLHAAMDAAHWATVTLRFGPASAEVLLDGHRLATQPGLVVWRVAPGEHELAVRATGYRPWVHHLEAAPSSTLVLAVVLEPRHRGERARPAIPQQGADPHE